MGPWFPLAKQSKCRTLPRFPVELYASSTRMKFALIALSWTLAVTTCSYDYFYDGGRGIQTFYHLLASSCSLTVSWQKQRLILDPIQEESDAPHRKTLKGWDAVDKRVRDSDENKVEDYKEDVDTLLVFVSCFHLFTDTWTISLTPTIMAGRTILSSDDDASHRII